MDTRRGGWGSLSTGDLVGDIIGVFHGSKSLIPKSVIVAVMIKF